MDAPSVGGWLRRLHGLVDQALDHGIDSVADSPPELVALFEPLDFGLMSLEGYRVEMIYKPLVLTATYTGGTAFGRYLDRSGAPPSCNGARGRGSSC